MSLEEVRQALEDCKPYLTNWRAIEELLNDLLAESSSINSVIEDLEERATEESDPTLRTDIRILVSRLKTVRA